jgi:hypothetical protein
MQTRAKELLKHQWYIVLQHSEWLDLPYLVSAAYICNMSISHHVSTIQKQTKIFHTAIKSMVHNDFNPEDGDDMFLQKLVNHLQDYIASQSWRQLISSLLLEPQVLEILMKSTYSKRTLSPHRTLRMLHRTGSSLCVLPLTQDIKSHKNIPYVCIFKLTFIIHNKIKDIVLVQTANSVLLLDLES